MCKTFLLNGFWWINLCNYFVLDPVDYFVFWIRCKTVIFYFISWQWKIKKVLVNLISSNIKSYFVFVIFLSKWSILNIISVYHLSYENTITAKHIRNKFHLIYRNAAVLYKSHLFLFSPQNIFFSPDKPLGSLRSREVCSINNSGQSDVVSRTTHAKTKEHRDVVGVPGGYSSMRPEIEVFVTNLEIELRTKLAAK